MSKLRAPNVLIVSAYSSIQQHPIESPFAAPQKGQVSCVWQAAWINHNIYTYFLCASYVTWDALANTKIV